MIARDKLHADVQAGIDQLDQGDADEVYAEARRHRPKRIERCLHYRSLEKELKLKVYFAHPNASWERGTVREHHGLKPPESSQASQHTNQDYPSASKSPTKAQ